MKNSIPPNLRWACRRGMLELDVLLGNFLEEAFLQLNHEDQQNFINLLENNDQDLFVWLTGKDTAADPIVAAMIEKIRLHAKTRHHTQRI